MTATHRTNIQIQGDSVDIVLTFLPTGDHALSPYRNVDGSRPMHIDFHNLDTDEKGKFENLDLPPSPGAGQSKLPALVGKFVARKAQETPLPTTEF